MLAALVDNVCDVNYFSKSQDSATQMKVYVAYGRDVVS